MTSKPSATNTRKLSKANSRKNRNNMRKSNAKNFALFDAIYSPKYTFFEDFVLYRGNLYGEIGMSIKLRRERIHLFVGSIIDSLTKALTDDKIYRRLKNDFGISGKTNRKEATEQIKNAVTDSCCLLLQVHAEKHDVQDYYHARGITAMRIPIFLYNLLSTLSASKRNIRIPNVPNSLMWVGMRWARCTVFEEKWPKADELPRVDVYKAIFVLESISVVLLQPSQSLVINDFTKFYESPRTFLSASCEITKTENVDGQGKRLNPPSFTDQECNVKVGRTANHEAIFNAYLLNLEWDFEKLDCDENAIDYQKIKIQGDQMRTAIRAYAVKTYGSAEYMPIVKLSVITSAEIQEPEKDE